MKKIPTDGKTSAVASINNAFDALHIADLPQHTDVPAKRKSADSKPNQAEKLGRVHMNIEKSGRSGKTVTVLFGPGINALTQERREDLLSSLKRKFAAGGAIEGDKIEIQGDVRDRAKLFLQMLGFSA